MQPWPTSTEEWVGIVDDDESIRRSLARFLRVCGIPVQTFGSPEELLGHTLGQPCCLVIDVQLGTSTGFELRDRLAERCPSLPPIIFMSARDDLATLQTARRQEAWGWLRKPFSTDALLDLVRPHLREHSGAHANR